MCTQTLMFRLIHLHPALIMASFFGSVMEGEDGFGLGCLCEGFRVLVAMINPFLEHFHRWWNRVGIPMGLRL
jgi:hypothetical protein